MDIQGLVILFGIASIIAYYYRSNNDTRPTCPRCYQKADLVKSTDKRVLDMCAVCSRQVMESYSFKKGG